MKRFKVSVTQRHIGAGEPRRAKTCPIALALREQLPTFLGVEEVEVSGDHAEFGGFRVPLPSRAERFVSAFDENRKVKPFTFFLE